MKVQCAWCKKWGPDKAPLDDPSVSHGICPKCAKDFEKKNPPIHDAYEAFKRADEIWSANLRARWGRQAGDKRYTRAAELVPGYAEFKRAGEYWRKLVNASRTNPGESWHAGKMEEAERSERNVKKASLKDFYHGKAIAHFESALEERARTKTRKNPLAVFGLGNPPNHVSAKVAGIIYRRCIEVKAEKLGKFQKGFWRHPFDSASQVHVLALDNGDILLHSVAGIRLWERA